MLTRHFNLEKLTSLLRSPAICNCNLCKPYGSVFNDVGEKGQTQKLKNLISFILQISVIEHLIFA